jgi:hypothetical protein
VDTWYCEAELSQAPENSRDTFWGVERQQMRSSSSLLRLTGRAVEEEGCHGCQFAL